MAERSSASSVSVAGVEATAIGLTGLCGLMFMFHILLPMHWTGLAVLVLAVGAVGFRIEAAIRSLRKD